MINKFNQLIKEFNEYIGDRKLKDYQLIIEFYKFINKFHEHPDYEFPFSRYVRVSTKISKWAGNDIKRAYGLIWDSKIHFEEAGLNWNLDTAYRHIPEYEEYKITHEHEIFNDSDIEDFERENTKKRLEEFK